MIDQLIEVKEERVLTPNRQEEVLKSGSKFIYLQDLTGDTDCDFRPNKPSVFCLVMFVDKKGLLVTRETKSGDEGFSFDLQRIEFRRDTQDKTQEVVIRNTLYLDKNITMDYGIDYLDMPPGSRFCGVVQEIVYDSTGKVIRNGLIIYPRESDVDKFGKKEGEESAKLQESLRSGEELVQYWPEDVACLKEFRRLMTEKIDKGEIVSRPTPKIIDLQLLPSAALREETTPFLILGNFAKS